MSIASVPIWTTSWHKAYPYPSLQSRPIKSSEIMLRHNDQNRLESAVVAGDTSQTAKIGLKMACCLICLPSGVHVDSPIISLVFIFGPSIVVSAHLHGIKLPIRIPSWTLFRKHEVDATGILCECFGICVFI